MSARASASVIGVVLLLLVGIALGSVVAAGAEAVAAATGADGLAGDIDSDAKTGPIALSLRVDGDRIAVTHEAGEPLPLADVRIEIAIGGDALRHQPPVPFFAATGFRGGPEGPFNLASDGVWSAGETGAIRLASTNEPQLRPGRTVSVTIYVGVDQVSRVRGTVD